MTNKRWWILVPVLLVLIGFVAVLGFRAQLQENRIIDTFESTLNNLPEDLLNSFTGVVYSNQLDLVKLSGSPLGLEVREFREAEGDEGGINYLLYAYQYLPEFFNENYQKLDCSQYQDSLRVKCEVLNIFGGESIPSEVFETLKSVDFESFRDVYNMYAFCSEFSERLSPEKRVECLNHACLMFKNLKFSTTPASVCEQRFYADLNYRCRNDLSTFLNVADAEILTLEDVACYLGSYEIYRSILASG
ncbi:MAG TPA: hypothetical protein ENN60_01060 [archaeon]|nr:hypothetical protein [archaeon]